MTIGMGADQILLQPQCPAPEDPEILDCLRIAKELGSADWVELSLNPEGSGSPQVFVLGDPGPTAATADLGEIGGFSASLRLGSESPPDDDLTRAFTRCLKLVFVNRRLGAQTFLLRAALDTTSDFILLFDESGSIMYANPPADALLSLQTEDQLLADCNGYPRQPLFTLLCQLVEHNGLRRQPKNQWKGVIHLVDGRLFSGEIRFLEEAAEVPARAVMVRLQTAGPGSESRIEEFGNTHGLSPREFEVLHLLVQGLTTVAMAENLGISPHTVRDHLKHLYRKTATGSRNELLGLISGRPKR